ARAASVPRRPLRPLPHAVQRSDRRLADQGHHHLSAGGAGGGRRAGVRVLGTAAIVLSQVASRVPDPYTPPSAPLDTGLPKAPEPIPARCPKCGQASAEKMTFTWWGGLVGWEMNMVRCRGCRTYYNGRTGKSLAGTALTLQILTVAAFVAL